MSRIEKDLHECKHTKPFEFKEDYHYYNPSIYSMGAYFNGHNLRQMKRYAYIIWRLGYGYENLYKHTLVFGSTPQIDKMLSLTKELCVHAHKVYEQLSKFKADSEFSRFSDKAFGNIIQSENRHMSVEMRESLTRERKYVIQLDEWGHDLKELKTKEDFKKHWSSFIKTFVDEATLFVMWGHWFTNLFISDLESGEESELDLANLDALIQKGIAFAPQLEAFRRGTLK